MTAFTTARALVTANANERLLAEIAEGDELAISLFEGDVRDFERLWAKTDAELVAELAEIRAAQRYAADERDWDEYEGWEVARYFVYAVQSNREALADEAEVVVGAEPEAHLTHRPFAALLAA